MTINTEEIQTTNTTFTELKIRQYIAYGEMLLALSPTERKQKRYELRLDSKIANECMQVAGEFGSKSHYDQTLVCRTEWAILELLSRYGYDDTLRERVIALVMHWNEHFWTEKYIQALHGKETLPLVTCANCIVASLPMVELALNGFNEQAVSILYAKMQTETGSEVEEPLYAEAPYLDFVSEPINSWTPALAIPAEVSPSIDIEKLFAEAMPMFEQRLNETVASKLHAGVTYMLEEIVQEAIEKTLARNLLEVSVRHEKMLAIIESSIQATVDIILRDSFTRRTASFDLVVSQLFERRSKELVELVKNTHKADQETIAQLKEQSTLLQQEISETRELFELERQRANELSQRLEGIKEMLQLVVEEGK